MRLPDPFEPVGEHIGIALPGARALFSTRRGGVSDGPFATLNLGLTTPAVSGSLPDAQERVVANRARLAQAIGVPAERFAHGHQVHGREVSVALAPPSGSWARGELGTVAKADGQATALRDVVAIVLTADCLPVALAGEGAVAMVHAGWRGLAAGVIDAGVVALRRLGVGGPIVAAIGPGAGACCYEVGEDVLGVFAGRGASVRDGRHLDLAAIATHDLAAAGVQQVFDVGLCTICSPQSLFFSHRRDGGVTGRQAGVAWRS